MAKKIRIIPELDESRLRQQLNNISRRRERIKVDLDSSNIRNANNHMRQLNTTVTNSNKIFGKLKSTISNTFSASRITMTGFLALMNSIRKASQEAKEAIQDIDSAITNLSIATNESRKSMSALVEEYNGYARVLGSTTTQVTDAADAYLRAGKSMSEAQTLIQDSLMLSKLGQIDSDEATEDILAVMNGYEMSIEEVGEALDAMVAIDMKAATSAGDIATALKYSASSADMAGVSFNKLAAMIGTVQDKTQQSAETVGTFMNTLLSRYRNVKIGQFVDDDGEDLSEVETILKSLDIKLRDSNQEFRNFEDVIDEVAIGWENYSSVQQAAIAKAFAGTRQQNRFIALMEGYNKTLALTEVAANSAGTAVEKFNNSYKDSLEAKQNTLQASFESMVINSDLSEVYSGIIEATTALVDFINKTNALKGVMSGLTVGFGVKAFLAIRTAINESYISLNKFGNALNIVSKTNISKGDFNKLLLLSNGLSTSQMKLVLATDKLSVSRKRQLLMASGLTRQEANLQLQTWKMTSAQTGLTAATTTLGNAFKGLIASMVANPIMAISLAVSATVMAYQTYNQKLEETRQKNIEASESAIEQADSLRELYDEYTRLSAIQNRTSSEEESFKIVIEDVTKALGDKANVLDGLTAGTNEYAEALAKVTQEELQSASVEATIGRKSAEEELQGNIWSDWSGSKVTIDSNDKGKALSEEAQKAVDIVSDSLKDFQTINQTWDNISWDISSNSPEEAFEYYTALRKAREELVLAAQNDEELLNTEIYSDLNNAINTMSDSLDSYIEKKYAEEKLNYMANNGIPQTTEAYKRMKESILASVSASDALQNKFEELLTADFVELAVSIEESVKEGVDVAQNSVTEIPITFGTILNTEDYEDTKEALIDLAKSGELTEDTLTSTREYRDLLTETGTSAKAAMAIIEQLALVEIDFEDYQTQLENARSSISDLQEILADMKENNGVLSDDSIDKIISDYPTLIDYLGKTEELETKINELINEQTTNAQNASDKMLEYSTEVYDAVLNSTEDVLNGITICVEGETKGLTDYLSDAYDTDLRNFSNLAQAKEKLEKDLIGELAEKWGVYYGLKEDAITGQYSVTQNMSDFYKDPKAQSQLAAYNEAITKLNATAERFKSLSTDSLSTVSSSSSSSSSKETIETFNWVETLISRIQRNITNLGKTVSATYKKWSTRNNALAQEMQEVNNEISAQMSAYNAYMAKAESIPLAENYKALVRSGAYSIEDIADESVRENIELYETWYEKALECSDAIEDLRADLADLAMTKFDNVSSQYDSLISQTEHYVSMLEGYVDQAETAGYMASEAYYKAMSEKQEENIAQLQEKYSSLLTAFDDAVKSGAIEKYSEDWYDMYLNICDVEQEIQDATTQLIEFNQTLQQLSWDAFDRVRGYVSNIVTEAEFLIDILDGYDLHTDKGVITNEGLAVQGLHAVNYNTYMEQSIAYAEELKKIQEEMANDPYDMELVDRYNELVELQQEAISNVMSEKEAIVDLISQGYDKMLESLNELISKIKEAHQAEKDLYSYQNSIEEKNKTKANLQKQIKAYENDTSESGKATLQKLYANLEVVEKDLEQTQYEKWVDDQNELLDKFANDTEQWVQERLDGIDGLIAEAVDATNKNAEIISNTIYEASNAYGYKLSTQMETIWDYEEASIDGVVNVVSIYGDVLKGVGDNLITSNENIASAISGGTTNVISTIGTLNSSMKEMITALNNMATANANSIASAQTSVANGQSSSYSSNTNASNVNISTSNGTSSGTTSGNTSSSGTSDNTDRTVYTIKNQTTSSTLYSGTKSMCDSWISNNSSKYTRMSTSGTTIYVKENNNDRTVYTVKDKSSGSTLYSGTKSMCDSWISSNNKTTSSISGTTIYVSEKRYYVQDKATGQIIHSSLSYADAMKYDTSKYTVQAYASGTDNAKKGWAVVGEEGNEIILDKEGNVLLTLAPQLMKLGGGETVLNADETASVLSNNLMPLSAEQLWGNIVKTPDLPVMSKNTNSNTTYSVDKIELVLPNVKDYDSLVTEMQHDKRFEKIVQSIVVDPMRGKGSLGKFRY